MGSFSDYAELAVLDNLFGATCEIKYIKPSGETGAFDATI